MAADIREHQGKLNSDLTTSHRTALHHVISSYPASSFFLSGVWHHANGIVFLSNQRVNMNIEMISDYPNVGSNTILA